MANRVFVGVGAAAAIGVVVAIAFGVSRGPVVGAPSAIDSVAAAPAPARTPPPRTIPQRTADLLAEAKGKCEHPSASRIRSTLVHHFPWEDETIESIACRAIHEGMSGEEVRASWGAPETVNTTHTASSSHEQWVYGDQYVYLENGRVTSWQSSR